MKARPAAVIFILVTVTLDILAMGLIIPVLPKLILDFLGGEMTDAAKWSARFAVVFALMQFFFSPLLGVLSDRFGRRPIILLSNLGLGLDYIVMAMAPTLSWLFLGRIIPESRLQAFLPRWPISRMSRPKKSELEHSG